jgi:sulfate/thiosulfate-binding protein
MVRLNLFSSRRVARGLTAALVGAGALLATAALPAGAASTTITLVAYSTPKPAYTTLVKDFQATSAGSGVTVTSSFGPSGTQATAVNQGLHATVVNFSLAPTMTKLVKTGQVAANWDKGPTKGMVTNSVVAFVVRKGNPKHIKGWATLTKSGIGVITPNPFSSGSARWNLMAAYGAQLAMGKSKKAAQTYLTKLLKNVVAQPTSASTALQTFLSGEGTVVLDYEDDGLYAKSQNETVTVVIPAQTILIQNPIAVTTDASNPKAAKAFVAYLESKAGQTAWGQLGYRPVLPKVAAKFTFPKPKNLFTITSLGGWNKVTTTFFTPIHGVVSKIESGLGISTSSG